MNRAAITAPRVVRDRAAVASRWLTPILVTMVLLTLGGGRCAQARADAPPASTAADSSGVAPDSTNRAHRVVAYYFHTTQRCVTCRKIEATTAEAIQGGFAEELKDGRLVFTAVNTDESANKHFLADYQLFTKSVVLVDVRNGSQVTWKNLPKIWELIHDKEQFVRYIQEETRKFLVDAQP